MLKYVKDNNNHYQNDQPQDNPNKSIIDYRYNHHNITNSTNSITN